jgi:CHASE3 domain sensor protein
MGKKSTQIRKNYVKKQLHKKLTELEKKIAAKQHLLKESAIVKKDGKSKNSNSSEKNQVSSGTKKYWKRIGNKTEKMFERFVVSAASCIFIFIMNLITASIDSHITIIATLLIGHQMVSFALYCIDTVARHAA